jgi:hypothetical protein
MVVQSQLAQFYQEVDMPRRTHPRGSRQVSKRRGVFLRDATINTGPKLIIQPGVLVAQRSASVPFDGRCGGRPNGKKRYVGWQRASDALDEIRRIRRENDSSTAETSFYLCTDKCGAYHLTGGSDRAIKN